MIRIKYFNDVHMKIECEHGIALELSDYFTFMVPGYKFMNAYRFGSWDGKIRLFKMQNKTLYAGLINKVREFAQNSNYEVEVDPKYASQEFSVVDAKAFCSTLKVPFEIKDYQLAAFTKAVRNKRGLFVSPTASGKSFIIYHISKYYNKKTLIIVPTIPLVNQMKGDFISYGEKDSNIHTIQGGKSKETFASVTISTWQSIYKLPKEWFDQFEVVIGDEAHLFKATSLVTILEKLTHCEHKFGFTGTLDGSLTNELVLEGLFGPKKVVTTTRELMDSGDIASLRIKSIVLSYPEEIRKAVKGGDYQSELAYLFAHEGRNRFIKKLALGLKGNTLVIFSRVDAHGIPLHDDIKAESPNPVYLVHGKIEGEERDEIRKIVNTHENSITVASAKTFSTGINIPNLNNIIFASPSKSRITVMQSIGRGLRVSKTKNTCVLYDICDDLSHKKWKNYTLLHYLERIKMYMAEKLEYKQYTVEIK